MVAHMTPAMERSAKKKSQQPEISIEERREQHGKKDKTRTKIDKRFCQQFVLPLLISIITSTKFPQKGRKNAKAYIRPSVEFIILCNEKQDKSEQKRKKRKGMERMEIKGK